MPVRGKYVLYMNTFLIMTIVLYNSSFHWQLLLYTTVHSLYSRLGRTEAASADSFGHSSQSMGKTNTNTNIYNIGNP